MASREILRDLGKRYRRANPYSFLVPVHPKDVPRLLEAYRQERIREGWDGDRDQADVIREVLDKEDQEET